MQKDERRKAMRNIEFLLYEFIFDLGYSVVFWFVAVLYFVVDQSWLLLVFLSSPIFDIIDLLVCSSSDKTNRRFYAIDKNIFFALSEEFPY